MGLMSRVGAAILVLIALGLAIWAPGSASAAADPPSCREVRLSDIGWTDVSATTGVADVILTRLGYRPKINVLSVPVTYAALKNKDIDVFLGNWMPSMAHDQGPFVADGSVRIVRANLTGAKYTLAVPTYLYDAGLKDFSDIRRFRSALGGVIYGLESGNDGNHQVLNIIAQNAFGLGDFRLVESSEQGMLAQVERAYRAKKPIVFLGWAPHPMNTRFDMSYLTGGDAYFGKNFGGAVIYTNVRDGYLQQCPNVGRLLRNLSFTLVGESQLMGLILNGGKDPETAARIWLKANPGVLPIWLNGVSTFDGRPGLAAFNAPQAHATGFSLQQWIADHKLPLGAAVTFVIAKVKQHMSPLFDGISFVAGGVVNGLTAALTWIPAPILILCIAGLAHAIRRSIPLTVFVVAALLFIVNQGYWSETVETLSLVLVASLVSTILGVPIGIAAAHRPWLNDALRPVLDLMQTLPTFVYLIPTLILFGLGVVPGLISTVIFAIPAPIRLTQMGIASAPKALIEAGQAFGATKSQLLWKIELPAARSAIVAGVTQCIMLCLSMVVIAALVGAGGLGVPVVRALNTVQVGMGFEAGFAIVLLAIILDRMARPNERTERS
jgi:glycine betaine/proline transport system substrate-binding protein